MTTSEIRHVINAGPILRNLAAGIAILSHVILFWANNNVALHKKENEKINLIRRIVGEFKKKYVGKNYLI
jgi:hypothetical protein